MICGKWHGRPEGTLSMTGITGNGLYSQQFYVADNISNENSRALPFFWARSRLSRLSDFSSRQDDEETRRQITELGLHYNLLTAYTAFVAVHERIRNPSDPAADVDQPLPLPQGVSNMAIGSRNVPEPRMGSLLVAAAAAGMGWWWRKRRPSPKAFQTVGKEI